MARLVLVLVALAAVFGGAPAAGQQARVFTVYLVRHAEKAAEPRQDPPLTDGGRARAETLARMLGPAGIKAAYTSQFLRTRATAEPLAKRLGVEPVVLPIEMSATNPNQISEASIDAIAARLVERGENALVVGHSNTVPLVIQKLGGDVVPTIDERTFDDLFVVTVHAPGRARVAHLKYGD